MQGVVRAPSALSITGGIFPSISATQHFVVPKSMPIALPIKPTQAVRASRIL
jgi:hypothetical protein